MAKASEVKHIIMGCFACERGKKKHGTFSSKHAFSHIFWVTQLPVKPQDHLFECDFGYALDPSQWNSLWTKKALKIYFGEQWRIKPKTQIKVVAKP